MATYLRTSGLFRINNGGDNAVRFMVSSFATEGTENMIVTLKQCTTQPLIGQTCTEQPANIEVGDKETICTITLPVPACGCGFIRWENLDAGEYELDLKFFDNELKPTADIRDGSINTAPNYGRFFLSPSDFVRQIEEGA